ncbi:MAG TPA: VWA domain-containing protein [Polyangia bacterium]|nr:VWA domain-containing protein [Polyangia bacterium]
MRKQAGIGLIIGLAGSFLIASGGCAGLKLQMVDHSVHRPSNVAVYFSVETRNGQPVANLTPQDFKIYEDKQPVSILESKQTILNPEVAAIHYTLLLIDMSGSVVDSGDMPALIQAASTFGDRVGPYQKIAVYTFDGSPHLTGVVPFGGNVRAGVASLGNRRPRDPSTNLNGAVIEGVRLLSQQMERGPVPLRFGTLVVFTDGTDRAHRASEDDVMKTLDSAGTSFETYVIGAGQEVDKTQLSRIGRSGTFASQNRADVQRGFDEISARIEANSKKYYLLSYCSPSRAGDHEVEIEANGAGSSGRLGYSFNANGFGPGCDPNTRPSFDIKHPRQPLPPPHAATEHPQQGGPPPAPSRGGVAGTGWNPKR